MQTYLFKCNECGKVFKRKLHFVDDQTSITCPDGHKDIRRLYTAPNILFKGPGFYINDSKKISEVKDKSTG